MSLHEKTNHDGASVRMHAVWTNLPKLRGPLTSFKLSTSPPGLNFNRKDL